MKKLILLMMTVTFLSGSLALAAETDFSANSTMAKRLQDQRLKASASEKNASVYFQGADL